MVDKNKDYNKIKFLDRLFETKQKEAEVEEKIKEEQKPDWMKIQATKKIDNSKAIESRTGESQILSANQGSINNLGGSQKQPKMET